MKKIVRKELEVINKYQKEVLLIKGASSLLQWDKETNMPDKGLKTRAEQIAFLEKLIHEKITSEELFSALRIVEKEKLSKEEKIMVDKLLKKVIKLRKIPETFVVELAKTTTIAKQMWKEARKKNDFSVFLPYLEKIIKLKREEAKYIGLSGHPYNSLIDEYEEGMTVEKLTPLFDNLKVGLMDLIKKIEGSEEYKKQKLMFKEKNFQEQKQLELVHDVAKSMGITNDVSRIDLVEHPFTISISGKDVRITTALKKDYHLSAFLSIVHEAGHALHELGVLDKHEFNILGASPSYGIHESQSKFWENMIALNEPFWRYYFPKFDEAFSLNGDFEQWYREVNHVGPDFIRTEADEVHYCLHVVLRFEIEKDILSGKLRADELEKVWNEKTKLFFGGVPKNPSQGILQDVHWSEGFFGYFPSYAIGTIYAAQLYKKLTQDLPDIEGDIFIGDFTRITNWLNKNIHCYGAELFAEDLIKQVTGEGLNQGVLIDYLNEKYSKIYNF